jgi:hypothetical protein
MVELLYIDAMAGRVVLIQINSIKTKYRLYNSRGVTVLELER